jgi:hypothetical protein
MARKQPTPSDFTLFDIVYQDGSRRSNRRVPSAALEGLDGGDAGARRAIESQDAEIAVRSGRAPLPIKSIARSKGR